MNFKYKSREWSHPTGYKYLAVYKNAELLDGLTRRITAKFPRSEHRMKEQMDDAMRSFKANIVEGWKRPTTREYLNFLGYSQASLAELADNAEDCLRHGFISLSNYEEYYGWLKKSDYLLHRLVASLEEKMSREHTVPQSVKLRQSLLEQERKKEEGRKLLGLDEAERWIIERQKRLGQEARREREEKGIEGN